MTDQRLFSWREHVLSARMSPTTKTVLLVLSSHMTRMGDSCFPTTRQIAYESSLSHPSVIRHLKIALDGGWIKTTVHGFRGRRWRSHEYEPTLPPGAKIVLFKDTPEGQKAKKAGDIPVDNSEQGDNTGLPAQNADMGNCGQACVQPVDNSHWGDNTGLPPSDKVVAEVNLSSSLKIKDNDLVFDEGKENRPFTQASVYLILKNSGYSAAFLEKFESNKIISFQWVQDGFNESDLVGAISRSQEATGKKTPPLNYIDKVLRTHISPAAPGRQAGEYKSTVKPLPAAPQLLTPEQTEAGVQASRILMKRLGMSRGQK